MRYFLSILFASILNFGFSQVECIDPSLIDPDAICTFIYDPVCGCDGVTYSNSCIAETTAGVTMYTMGECGTAVECLDLADIDFGECEMAMGIALVDGECVAISGCGWEVGGTDYSPYSFTSFAACNAACTEVDCLDLAGIDFGLCDMAMGIALVDGECVAISGCDWEVGGIDYSPYFYQNMEDCEACLSGDDCFDLEGIDFGDCDMDMGVGLLNGECIAISGCGWEVGGIDYSPYGFESIEACESLCIEPCEDPSLIDLSMNCGLDYEPVCGCDNKTYWNPCYAEYHNGITDWTEGPCSCPDEATIDITVLCTQDYTPVCGCDGTTYYNACSAFYGHGITEWEPGECGMSVGELNQLAVNVYPNPVHSTLTIRLQNATSGTFELFDLSGKMILSGSLTGSSNTIDLSSLSSGTYLLKLNSGNASTQMPVYKID